MDLKPSETPAVTTAQPSGMFWDIVAFLCLSALVAVFTLAILALQPSPSLPADGGRCSATRN